MIRLAHDQSVHWIAILRELASFKLGDAAVAARIGATTQRVYAWRVVRCTPNANDGIRLLQLWHEVTGKDVASAPVLSLAEDFEP